MGGWGISPKVHYIYTVRCITTLEHNEVYFIIMVVIVVMQHAILYTKHRIALICPLTRQQNHTIYSLNDGTIII